jgi:hypothetical protein
VETIVECYRRHCAEVPLQPLEADAR